MASSPLNDRQLAVLRRIGAGAEPVTSAEPTLAITVYALLARGLVTTPRRQGVWQAELTEAGQATRSCWSVPDGPRSTTLQASVVPPYAVTRTVPDCEPQARQDHGVAADAVRTTLLIGAPENGCVELYR